MRFSFIKTILAAVLILSSLAAWAGKGQSNACAGLPDHASLRAALIAVVAQDNRGFGNDMWATVVNRDSVVCAVVYSGSDRHDQWAGSRAISAQKANTANAFSLDDNYPNLPSIGRALASGNLYGLTLPGGSLFGLQFSNPVDTDVAYAGNSTKYGSPKDPMVGKKIGGINVFGGGLALYDAAGAQIGGLGTSGDTSCTDHIIAWRVRDALGVDNIPGGVGDGVTNDNLILNSPATANSFEHPECGFGETPVILDLATTNPIGS